MSSVAERNSAPLPEFASFGEMLRFLRRRARMTQTELSVAVGYSVSQISRLEQNERIPDPATLQAAFVPALGLGREPETVARLLQLAKQNRAEKEGVVESQPVQSATRISNTAPPLDESLPGNLPLRLTSFIGRTHELNALQERLLTARLVTLIGPGGVGKSSLAIEAAKPQHFGDGVWLVELAAIQEGDLVAQTICSALRLPEISGRSALDSLLTYLHHKDLLLLLDNCEHLITTCATLVERLLKTCPKLHILATSREALAVDGEIEWAVHPLRTPNLPPSELQYITANELADFEAIHLFVERARSIKPDLSLNERNAPVIAEICQQLDGMPLALELAAARLNGLTLEELAAHLQDRFTLLVSGRRTALPRQQTLRATIDWSYELLNEAEKLLLRQAAVFVDGWTLAAAEAMAADEPSQKQILPLLLQLVNKSLVIADERSTETRYRMLESIRQYALEKLCDAGEDEQTRQRHFNYFLSLAEQSHDPSLIGRRLVRWTHQIAGDRSNLRSAFVWSRSTANRAERQLRLAGSLWLFWMLRYANDEGIAWLEEALAQKTENLPVYRATALIYLADLLRRVGQSYLPYVETALDLSQQHNHKIGIGHCLVLQADALDNDVAQLEQAMSYYQQALHYFQEVGHLLYAGYTQVCIADLDANLNRPEAARDQYLKSLEFAQEYEEITIVRWVFEALSKMDRKLAIRLCQKELLDQRAMNDPEALAATLETLGHILQAEGRYHEAQPILEESLTLWRKLNIKLSLIGGTARATFDLGRNYYLLGDHDQATPYIKRALDLYADVGDMHGVAWAHTQLGYILLRENQPEAAHDCFRAALHHSLDMSMNYLATAFLGVAQAKQALGNSVAAAHFFGVAARFEEKLFLVDPSFQQDLVDTLRNQRALLTTTQCNAAWEAGRQMSLEEAVKFL
ncbi:MAG: tetratricopeptide repeat protein [Caldilineaceae bacterium]